MPCVGTVLARLLLQHEPLMRKGAGCRSLGWQVGPPPWVPLRPGSEILLCGSSFQAHPCSSVQLPVVPCPEPIYQPHTLTFA